MHPDEPEIDYDHLQWLKENIKSRGLMRRLGAFYMMLVENAREAMIVSYGEDVPDIVEIIYEKVGWDRETLRAFLLFYSTIGRVRIIKHLPSPRGCLRTHWEINYDLDDLSSYSKDYEERPEFYEDVLTGRLTLEDLQEAREAVSH